MYTPRRDKVVAVCILVDRVKVVGIPWVLFRTRIGRCSVAILQRDVLDGAPVEDELPRCNVDLLEPAVGQVATRWTTAAGEVERKSVVYGD